MFVLVSSQFQRNSYKICKNLRICKIQNVKVNFKYIESHVTPKKNLICVLATNLNYSHALIALGQAYFSDVCPSTYLKF